MPLTKTTVLLLLNVLLHKTCVIILGIRYTFTVHICSRLQKYQLSNNKTKQ